MEGKWFFQLVFAEAVVEGALEFWQILSGFVEGGKLFGDLVFGQE